MFANFVFLGLAGGASVFVLLLVLVIFVFEVFMFVDVVRNKRITDTTRLLWAIGMLLVHPFVAIAYYFTDYKRV